MEAWVDTLRLLTQPKGQQQFNNKKQPELTENRTAWKSDNQGDTEEAFIQTSRRGGDGQPWQRALGAMRPDPETWWIVEPTGQAVRPLADPRTPHSRIHKPGRTAGERSRPCNPGLQLREIKLQTSD